MNKIARETPDIETSSDNYASRFAGRAGAFFLARQQETIESVLRFPFGRSVLDVGGGHGQLAPFMIEKGYKVTVIGSDQSCHTRLQSEMDSNSLNFTIGDLLDLPFPDKSFDLVISVRLISHIDDWPRLVSEFCRVSRHTIVIDYPSLFSLNVLTPLMFKLKKKIEGNTRMYTSFHKSMLAKEFGKHDFAITSQEKQFLIPMFVYRALKSPEYLKKTEKIFRAIGLTRLFGTPVILRLDRIKNKE